MAPPFPSGRRRRRRRRKRRGRIDGLRVEILR